MDMVNHRSFPTFEIHVHVERGHKPSVARHCQTEVKDDGKAKRMLKTVKL